MNSFEQLLQKHEQPEQLLYEAGFYRVAGVDEAGRGPLAGPVVAAAVILPRGWRHPGIKDSKKLSALQREKLFGILQDHAIAWSWALCEPAEIDCSNILAASLQAMHKALCQLMPEPDYIIVDGRYAPPAAVPQTPIVHGDAKSQLIAAASIIAKVVRDAIMQKYHALFPHYNFIRNKGYGTPEHLSALARHGRSPIHRVTFRRVPAQ